MTPCMICQPFLRFLEAIPSLEVTISLSNSLTQVFAQDLSKHTKLYKTIYKAIQNFIKPYQTNILPIFAQYVPNICPIFAQY